MRPTRNFVRIPLFLALLGFWFVLSGRLDPTFLVLGAISAAAVTIMTQDLVADGLRGTLVAAGHPLRGAWRFGVYMVWLLWRIIVGNVQVAIVICNPRVPVDPRVLRFRTRIQSRFARVMLANSITLTPGTFTVDLTEDTYVVHCLVPRAAGDILSGEMQNMVARIFFEAGLAGKTRSSLVKGSMPLRSLRAGIAFTFNFIISGTTNSPGPRRPSSRLTRSNSALNTP
jgi:multicomponent Na+:H+ antiporter subunit E